MASRIKTFSSKISSVTVEARVGTDKNGPFKMITLADDIGGEVWLVGDNEPKSLARRLKKAAKWLEENS